MSRQSKLASRRRLSKATKGQNKGFQASASGHTSEKHGWWLKGNNNTQKKHD